MNQKECIVCHEKIKMIREDEIFEYFNCCGIPQMIYKLNCKKNKGVSKKMKSIPINKLLTESQQTGVSIHLLTRRFMNYRKTSSEERKLKQCCGFCKASDTPAFQGVKRYQCHIIGIGNHYYADIHPCRTCDYFIQSDYKIKLQEDSQ